MVRAMEGILSWHWASFSWTRQRSQNLHIVFPQTRFCGSPCRKPQMAVHAGKTEILVKHPPNYWVTDLQKHRLEGKMSSVLHDSSCPWTEPWVPQFKAEPCTLTPRSCLILTLLELRGSGAWSSCSAPLSSLQMAARLQCARSDFTSANKP